MALAYSGGLASTLVAMVARKRCDLECIVAGSAACEDVRAAKAARQHLDYRITILEMDAVEAKRIMRRAEGEEPRLSAKAILTLLPLFAVRERAPDKVWLTGLGPQRLDPQIIEALRRLRMHSPLIETSLGTRLTRATLRRAATSLGLPEEWARIRHREPAAGAGIASFARSTERNTK